MKEGKVKNKRFKKRYIFSLSLLILIIAFAIFLYARTGFFNKNSIDKADLQKWDYNNGIIIGGEDFEIQGNKQTCWLLIHGYSSTPLDLKPVAKKINTEFNDYIKAIRLKGHSQVPSKLLNLTLDDWYKQTEQEYLQLKNQCENINVVGFSFGGALATRLSEKQQIQRTYLLAPYLYPADKNYYFFSLNTIIDKFADSFVYTKKLELARINDKKQLKNYISYLNFALPPVKYSKPFLITTEQELNKITNPILIQHSINDDTAGIKSSEIIFNQIFSEDKQFVKFEKSSHVLTFDYDKEQAINNIINFEKQRR